ncbi:DUF805 domain-containing protein [Streptomyces sp. NPDC050211]|uniref:DUF805 domain-containing protein n=1 Tax=Streptomyces sp. NPDC050211 TaxID=3154932 RepID=UPI00342A7408
MNWFVDVVKKYAVFNGRARRKEYWMFTLIYTVIAIVLSVVDMAVIGSNVLVPILTVALFLPALGVAIRRLHDTGRTGWWVLISIVPLVGLIVMLVFLCADSQDTNKYGPNPKFAPAHA